MASTLARQAVLTRIAGRALALPIEHVVETMRPLPIEPGASGGSGASGASSGDTPACVLGTAEIRGERIQVVDAARLFELATTAAPDRFVIVRAGRTRVALQVEAVIDVRELGDGAPVGALPGLGHELALALRDARWIEEP